MIYIYFIIFYRLGHGNDQHVRKPTVVESLRGKKIVHVAVGALHCLGKLNLAPKFSAYLYL